MSYVIYPLRFETAIHFGQPGRGGRLDEACMEYPADALFGALCTELAAAGETEQLARLTARIEAGELRFSDLLPWQAGRQGALAFFLPRPVLRIERTQQQEREDYSVTCANATLRKKQKKLKYLRASRIEDYIRAMQSGSPFEESDFDGDFGAASLRQHVNMRGDEPLPYYVGQFDFHAHAGLYLLADVRRELSAQEAVDLLERACCMADASVVEAVWQAFSGDFAYSGWALALALLRSPRPQIAAVAPVPAGEESAVQHVVAALGHILGREQQTLQDSGDRPRQGLDGPRDRGLRHARDLSDRRLHDVLTQVHQSRPQRPGQAQDRRTPLNALLAQPDEQLV